MTAPLRLGKYEIRRQLGKGSMGIVYEAFDPLIQRSVAIKVIREDEFSPEQRPDLLVRLKREAQAAGRLNHPAIVAIHDYGEHAMPDGSTVAYIAMELIEGRELKAMFDAGRRFTGDETERIMGGLLGALEHAHARGVTHRDIKPANVILLPDGAVKVADFGVARIDSSELTQTGMVLGTPLYMAPEQLLGLHVDGRADLFACGVLLYQFLTGEKPFSGSMATVIQKVLNEPAPPPTKANPALVPAWDRVLDKALAKKPEQRFQSAAEFAEAIRSATRSQSADDDGATVILPRARTLPTESAAVWPPRMPAAIASPAPAVRRGWIAGATLALAGAVIGGGYWFLSTVKVAPPAAAIAPAASAVPPPVAVLPPVETVSPPPMAAAPAAAVAVAVVPPAPLPPTARASQAAPAKAAPPPLQLSPARPATVAPSVPPPVPPVAQPVTPVGVPPTVSPQAAEWQAGLARLATARPSVFFSDALILLLDVRNAEQRQRIADFDWQLRQLKPHAALAMGNNDGWLGYSWRSDRSTAEQAQAAALYACQVQPARVCRTVLLGARFDRTAFDVVAASFGERGVAEVRGRFIASFDRTLSALRSPTAPSAAATTTPEPAQVQAPAPAPAPMPSVTAPARPAPAWPAALAALQRGRGQQDLAQALVALLLVESDDDRSVFARFERLMKRLPWKSALAMGEENGLLYYGHVWSDSNDVFAADRALLNCGRSAARHCVVVMANGKLNDDALFALASRLGARPPAAVREVLLRSMRRSLESAR